MNTITTVALFGFCALAGLLPWLPGRGRGLRGPAPGVPDADARRRVSGRSGTPAGVDVVVLLELLAAATRAGVAVPRALEAVGEAVGGADGRALREVGTGLILGASWRAAWDGAANPARLGPVDHALRSAWANGSAPGPALTAAGDQLRRDSARRARTAAGQLGVRLVVPLGACFLPAFILIGLLPVFVSLGAGLLEG